MTGTRNASIVLIGVLHVACGSGPRPQAPPATAERAEPPPAPPPTVADENCVDEAGMVYIPGGDGYVYADDGKTHSMAPFWLDRTEVTVAAFRAFVDAGYSPPWTPSGRHADLKCTWNLPDAGDLPINCVDWYQAEAYCLWAKKRLPTAQEWGWAAQGRDERRPFPWGSEKPSCELAVVDQDDTDSTTGCGRNQPWPVGSKPRDRTRDGVLDMFGSVGEWTSSGATPEERSPRIGKGSSWRNQLPDGITIEESGSWVVRESWSDNGGFRCAKDAGPKPPCTKFR